MKLNNPRAMPKMTCFQQDTVSPHPMIVLIKMSQVRLGLDIETREREGGEKVRG